jgi:hypothetical protein
MLIEQRIAVIAGTSGIAERIGRPLSRDELPSDGFMRVELQMVMGALITNPDSLMVQCSARSSMNRRCALPETHAA